MTDQARWSILPAYLVRAAGFSFDRLAVLRCAEAAAASAALDRATEARRAAGLAFDEALAQERFAEYPQFDDPAVRKAFSRQVKQARAFAKQLADVAPPADGLHEIARVVPRIAPRIDALAQAHAAWQDASRGFAAAFAADFERARGAIRRMYEDDARLQEAVFLESPEAYDRIRQLIAAPGPRNVRARQRERLAIMYAQRFCAKNDTNSFCGPLGVAYVTASPSTPAPTSAPAPARLEIVAEDVRRDTYFSQWAAQQLLDAAVARAGDAAPVTLQLHPTARVDDDAVAWCLMDHDATTMFRRRYARSPLPPGAATLVRALARPHTPAQLAHLADERALGFDAEDVASFVDDLVEAGLVLRGPILAPGGFHPLRAVAAELARWPDSEARAWAIAEVDAVEALVARFARAGLPERLEAFGALVRRFEDATGGAATRGQGRHYADRSLIHEDCCIEVRAELGPARRALDTALPVLLQALELSLELARARVHAWFRGRFGEGVRVAALDVHRAFDEDRVLETPATGARAALLRDAIARVCGVIERAVARTPAGPVAITSDELRAALAEVPPPDRAGYVSADLMLAHADGGIVPVLGEVHGFYWLPTCLLDILPPDDRARVLDQMRAAVADMAQGRRTAEAVFLHTQATDRRFRLAATDLEMLVPTGEPDALTLGGLELRLAGDTIEFWTGDAAGGEEVIPLVAYTRYPFLLYTSRIAPLLDDFSEKFFPDSLLPAALRDADAPRLVIDDLVVRRRTWRRAAPAVRAALTATAGASASEAELFRNAQALQRELGCGPVVFASIPGEPKPVLLDFQNVFLLEALVNLLDGQPADAAVKFSEMLPGPGELVAQAPDGPRTAELRMGFYRTPATTSPATTSTRGGPG